MADKKELDIEVANILVLINVCDALHSLPQAGGVLDQDSLFLHYFMYVAELREMRRKLDERKALHHKPDPRASGARRQWPVHENYG